MVAARAASVWRRAPRLERLGRSRGSAGRAALTQLFAQRLDPDARFALHTRLGLDGVAADELQRQAQAPVAALQALPDRRLPALPPGRRAQAGKARGVQIAAEQREVAPQRVGVGPGLGQRDAEVRPRRGRRVVGRGGVAFQPPVPQPLPSADVLRPTFNWYSATAAAPPPLALLEAVVATAIV